MSIYVAKTNQLLKIFKSSVKMRRSICSVLKEAFFPIAYICANGSITAIYLILYTSMSMAYIKLRILFSNIIIAIWNPIFILIQV